VVSFDDTQKDDTTYPDYIFTADDNGKVVRVQYSIYNCKDIVGVSGTIAPDTSKLELIKAIANYVEAGSSTSSQNYTDAISVLENWDATQAEVDSAVTHLGEAEHVHTASTEWEYDNSYHWHPCTWDDGTTFEWGSHSCEWVETTPATTTSTGTKSYICTDCGYVQNTQEIPKLSSTTEHTHTAGTTWSSDATNHWQTCTAGDGEEMNSAAHTFSEWTVTKAATEDEEGSQTRTCTVCGYEQTGTIAKLTHTHTAAETWQKDDDNHWKLCVKNDGTILEQASHTYGEWETVKAATEDATGTQKHTCTVCGYEQTGTIAKLTHTHTAAETWQKDDNNHWKLCVKNDGTILEQASHTYGDWEIVTQATEDATGIRKHTCKVCGYEQTDTIDKLTHVHTAGTTWSKDADYHWKTCTKNDGEVLGKVSHSFGDWETVTEATEDTVGSQKRTCTVCGYEQTGEIPKKEHEHAADTTSWEQNATMHWNNCVKDDDEKMNLDNHDFGDWVTIKEATDNTEGEQRRTCSVCGYVDDVVIPVLGHTHEADESQWIHDTDQHWHNCTANDGERMSAADHSFGEWNTEVEATENSVGRKKRVCLVCGYEETQEVAKLAHTHSADDNATWKMDENGHWHECSTDYEQMDYAEHTYGDWNVETAASESQEGSKTRTCSVCGYVDRQTIPTLSHTHTADTSEWKKDAEGHWHDCVNNDGEKLNLTSHDYGDWEVETAASENQDGSQTRTCSVCGYVDRQTISALSHTHTADTSEWKKDAEGHWHDCVNNDGEKMDSTSHTYGGWTVETEASESQDGSQTRTCSVCGYVDRQTISALSHTHTADTSEWKKDADNHWHNCVDNDGEKMDSTSHTYGTWQTVKAATEQVEGLEKRVCSVCNYEQTRTIQKLESSVKQDSSKNEDTKNTSTESQPAAVGTTLPDTGKVTYKVNGNQTVEYTANKTATGSVKIPITVTTNGVTYKVTTVAASAFKNNKKITSVTLGSNITSVGKDAFSGCTKLKSVTIGKNVTTIGKNAFKGCKKLKTITINSTKLKKSKVGSNAFKGISSKATIKVPKSKYKEYKKWFKSKGLSSKVKIKKK
jgi:hypothetical protein